MQARAVVKIGVAAVAGLLVLLASVSFGMRGPRSWLRQAPADATTLEGRAQNVGLRPLSEEYVDERSQPERAAAAPVRTPVAKGRTVPQPAVEQEEEQDPDGYPSGEACSVDNSGLLPGESRSCRFAATAPGGWAFAYGADAGITSTSATVTVDRNGDVTVYQAPSQGGGDCGEDIIRPGDLVDLSLTNGGSEVSVGMELGAGRGWDCNRRGG